jgi:hypothetical protein
LVLFNRNHNVSVPILWLETIYQQHWFQLDFTVHSTEDPGHQWIGYLWEVFLQRREKNHCSRWRNFPSVTASELRIFHANYSRRLCRRYPWSS